MHQMAHYAEFKRRMRAADEAHEEAVSATQQSSPQSPEAATGYQPRADAPDHPPAAVDEHPDDVIAYNAVAKKLNVTLPRVQGFLSNYVHWVRPAVYASRGDEKHLGLARQLLEAEALNQGLTTHMANQLIRWYEARSPDPVHVAQPQPVSPSAPPPKAAPSPSPEEAKALIKQLTADAASPYVNPRHKDHEKAVAHVRRLYQTAYPE